MKRLTAASISLALGALTGALLVGCADSPKPANSAQNQSGASSGDTQSSPGAAASAKDGGGGGGW